MTKARLVEKRMEKFSAVAIAQASDKSLHPEIDEAHAIACHESRLRELRRQYLSGTYYVPTSEISTALIEKHLKR